MTRLAIVLVVTAACADDPAPDPEPALCTGGWHVCGGAIRDADGRTVVMRGMNVSSGNKVAPYLDWHAEADFARMRDAWGFNAIRWVMPWAAVEPERGAYDDAYLAAVRERLDWAEAHGILVVLDMHQDVYGEGFGFDGAPRWTCDEARYADFERREPWPLNYLDDNVVACFDELWMDPAKGEAFAAAWAHVAAALGDHPAVIGFDVINEPHWGSTPVIDFERDLLQPFYDRVVAAVRAEAPGWLAFLEPASSRNLGFPTTLEPFAYADVVYAPHAYDAAAEQGGGFDPERRDSFMRNIDNLRDEADRLGAALWIGEYGGMNDDPNLGAYMAAAYDGAGAVGASTMYWDYGRGGSYHPLDADGNELPRVIDAIARTYPSRIAGDLVDYSYVDPPDAPATFTVRWRPDARIAAPTEIIVYNDDDVTGLACDHCELELDGDVVRVTVPPIPDADGIATLVISP